MRDTLKVLDNNNTQILKPQNSYIQTAPNSKQFFGDVGAVHSNATYIVTGQSTQQSIVMSTEYCNVFVKKDENFATETGSFEIFESRLRLNDRFDSDAEIFADNGIQEIMTYPSLFMDTLHGDKQCANPNQEFYYGIVTNVEKKATGAKISYRRLSVQPLYQQALQDISLKIGIDVQDGQNVLDNTQWLIRKINLRKALVENDIYL